MKRSMLQAVLFALFLLVGHAVARAAEPRDRVPVAAPNEPSVTIDAPTAVQGGVTFGGSVDTVKGAWLAGAQAAVKVTNKAGGTAIPTFFGQVNQTQTKWGPSGALALPPGKYIAVVELKFTKANTPAVTKTALVEFEVK